MINCVVWAQQKAANAAVLPLILWGVSLKTGLPGWLSAPIKPDGFLTLNKWIDLCGASLIRVVFFSAQKGGESVFAIDPRDFASLSGSADTSMSNVFAVFVSVMFDKVLGQGLCHHKCTPLTPQVVSSSAHNTLLLSLDGSAHFPCGVNCYQLCRHLSIIVYCESTC